MGLFFRLQRYGLASGMQKNALLIMGIYKKDKKIEEFIKKVVIFRPLF